MFSIVIMIAWWNVASQQWVVIIYVWSKEDFECIENGIWKIQACPTDYRLYRNDRTLYCVLLMELQGEGE